MLPQPHESSILKGNASLSTWVTRLVISLTILAWLALAAVVIWAIGEVFRAFVLVLLGATIATVVYPLVRWLERKITPPWAVTIVYIIALCLIAGLLYYLISTIIIQIGQFVQYLQSIFANGSSPVQSVLNSLHRLGISTTQIQNVEGSLISRLQGILTNLIPLLSSIFGIILDIILIVLLSIYFLLVGPRVIRWLRTSTPVQIRGGTNYLVDTLERVVGGNFRGTFILGLVMGFYVGTGAYFIRIPFPLLLGSIAFVLEFIPVLGFYLTAITTVLFALTNGWVMGVIALGYVLLGQGLEGELLAPRIVGHTIGIHPIIIIVALIAGVDLFGILGAFYSGPAAGLIQAVFFMVWRIWVENHPDQFPKEVEKTPELAQDGTDNARDKQGKPG